MSSPLAQPLTLPSGAVLPNRLAKAAMSEGLSDPANRVSPRLKQLYRRWSESGAGLLLSGNIQVDRWHLERPANMVLEDDSDLAAFAELAAIGKAHGAAFWAQISHTGRQVQDSINTAPLAPSVVEIEVMRGVGYAFAKPVEMTEADITHAIAQFATTARLAKQAGFDGVELHGAHGYLISQFLSARTNRRTDRWGGDLRARATFLLETIAAVRAAVGPEFPIGLKLNASDFQKGGFTNADCIEVVRWLNDSTLDLLELSGGSLEQPKQMGVALQEQGEDGARDSTRKREAYFIEFAASVKAVAKMPVMVTGGFRSRAAMEQALEAGDLDVVGLGRPMIADPMTPAKLLSGAIDSAFAPEKSIHLLHLLSWSNIQLERMGDGRDPDLNLPGESAVAAFGPLEKAMTDALQAYRAAESPRRACV